MVPLAPQGSGRGWVAALVVFILIAPGCARREGLYTLEPDLPLAPPPGWLPVDRSELIVPGTPLAGWRGPDGGTLVVYRTLPVPGPKPAALAAELAIRLENLPGVEVVGHGTVTLADGSPAGRVDASEPGPTYRISLILPRDRDTLWITWRAPESRREAIVELANAQISATIAESER